MEHLKYPQGRFEYGKTYSSADNQKHIAIIEQFPKELNTLVATLTSEQLEKSYRPNGWNAKQIIHHLADSHMNAYCRFKLGLTEDNPTIRLYEEQLWAELSDTQFLPANVSITLLYALHTRWHVLLKHIQGDTWKRSIVHPASKKQMDLWYLMGLYAWHGKHHVAHVTSLRERHGW